MNNLLPYHGKGLHQEMNRVITGFLSFKFLYCSNEQKCPYNIMQRNDLTTKQCHSTVSSHVMQLHYQYLQQKKRALGPTVHNIAEDNWRENGSLKPIWILPAFSLAPEGEELHRFSPLLLLTLTWLCLHESHNPSQILRVKRDIFLLISTRAGRIQQGHFL